MEIKNLNNKELYNISKEKEGIVFQGCGGDLEEWIEGITGLFRDNEIIKEDYKFNEIYTFSNNDCTNLLFMLDKNVNVNKLAIFRLSLTAFGAKWLSDYVVNNNITADEFIKPKAEIIGADGNIFNIMGIASKSLKRSGLHEGSEEMIKRITNSKSYDDALCIVQDYIDPVEVGYHPDEDYDIGI